MLTWKVVVFFPSLSISAELYEGVSCLFFKCQPESDARDELINSLILRNDWITIQLLINSLFFTAPAHPDAVLHVYPPSCCIYLSLISWCCCAAAAVQRINEMQLAQPPPSRHRVVDSTLILNARLISQVPPASYVIGAKQQLAYLFSFVWMTGRLIKRKTRPAQHSTAALLRCWPKENTYIQQHPRTFFIIQPWTVLCAKSRCTTISSQQIEMLSRSRGRLDISVTHTYRARQLWRFEKRIKPPPMYITSFTEPPIYYKLVFNGEIKASNKRQPFI